MVGLFPGLSFEARIVFFGRLQDRKSGTARDKKGGEFLRIIKSPFLFPPYAGLRGEGVGKCEIWNIIPRDEEGGREAIVLLRGERESKPGYGLSEQPAV